MKFIVTRASYLEDEKPCGEAVRCEATYLDMRVASSIEEAKKYWWFEEWFNSTVNHREANGYIIGERKVKVWVVELNTLKELIDFIHKYNGYVIIYKFDYKEYPYVIEICDCYEE